MRYYLVDGNEIVTECAGDDTWCWEAMNAHPEGIVSEAPPVPLLESWHSARDAHRYFVSRANWVKRPFVTAAFADSVLDHWNRHVGYELLSLDALRVRSPALAGAWLEGDDTVPDEDTRLSSLDRDAEYLEEMWIVNTTWEEFLERDAANSGADKMAGAVPDTVMRVWFEGRRREVTAGLGAMGLADLI
jgi:hypothetical protein